MPGSHVRVMRAINGLTAGLVELGLADDQNFAYVRPFSDAMEVTYPSELSPSYVLRARPYAETYSELRDARAFNVRLLDGGLLQLSYRFQNDSLVWHRLAFLPSPTLEAYQDDPELYARDELYSDIVDVRVVTVPVRFDFDVSESEPEMHHPMSHLTLGQYNNCRIPVSSPVHPEAFFAFVLQSFYNTPSRTFTTGIDLTRGSIPECISEGDRKAVHVVVP